MKKILFIFALVATLGASSIDKCVMCHGKHFEKKALGQSLVVADMNSSAISDALHGFKNGTYGGKMKGVMVAQLKDENITILLEDIAKVTKK